MIVYLVRHGQTDYNINGKIGGRLDVPLNERGIEEAYELKEKIKGIPFEKVYSSPLQRAFQTAEILTDEPIIVDDRLMERSNGDLEGMYKVDAPKDIRYNDPNEDRYHIENCRVFKKRIFDFLDDLDLLEVDGNILVVMHAGVGMYARSYFEGDPIDGDYQKLKLQNCEVKKYQYKKR